jgi:hypothetical protein
MTLRLVWVVALAALLLAFSAAPAQAAGPVPEVAVSVDRPQVSTTLGHHFTFRSTVANAGAASTGALVAHLNVLSYDRGVYVDPEDWSSNRTRDLAPIPAGGSTTLAWKLQAVNAGSFAAYVTVLPQQPRAGTPATGQTVHVAVAKRTTIDSGGIVPLALGVPALLAALLVGLRLRRRG